MQRFSRTLFQALLKPKLKRVGPTMAPWARSCNVGTIAVDFATDIKTAVASIVNSPIIVAGIQGETDS
jgi:hypothetical protein